MPTFKLFNPCQPCCVSPSGVGCLFCGQGNVNLFAHFDTISGDCSPLDNICVPLICPSGGTNWSGTRIVDGNNLTVSYNSDNTLFWEWGSCTNNTTQSSLFLEQSCSGTDPYALFLTSGIEPFACACYDGDSRFNVRVDTIPCPCCQYDIPDTICGRLYRDTSLGGSGAFNFYPYCPCILDWYISGYIIPMNKVPGSGSYWYGSTTSALCNVPLAMDFRCESDGTNISGFAHVILDDVVHDVSEVGLFCPTNQYGDGFQIDGNVHLKQHQFFSGEACFCLAGSGIHFHIEPTGVYCISRGLLRCCDGTIFSMNSGIYHDDLHGSVLSSPGCCFDGLDFTLARFAADNTFAGHAAGCAASGTDSNRPFLEVTCITGPDGFLSCSGVSTDFLSGIVESCCPFQMRLYMKTKHDLFSSGCCNANITTEVLITE